jgi:LDH2 family malate/lactate/ureidoglycolate dehydrogenase
VTTIRIDALEQWTVQVLRWSGLRYTDAQHVANNLAYAESRGIVTHGLLRLPTYIERVRQGGINKDAVIRIEHDLGALVIVEADDGPGAASGVYAADLAAMRARQHGIGCAIVRNGNHFGASGYYTNRIADNGLLGIALCNTEPVMCAPFGGRAVLGTNPLAVAAPLPPESRPQLDMATTTASQGKLLIAKQAAKSIPFGWAVDAQGHETDSASAGLEGALLPSGGPKGFGIAFAIDAILATGDANVSTDVGPLHGDPAKPQRLGQAFIALRADAAGPVESYHARIDRLIAAIHGSAIESGRLPAPVAPGEPELARLREIDGRVTFNEAFLAILGGLAESAGVPLPECASVPA